MRNCKCQPLESPRSPLAAVGLPAAAAACCLSVLVCAPMRGARADVTSPKLDQYRDQVEAAADRALAWLAKNQTKSGAFMGANGGTNAVVGLCAMAFLSKGYTPGHEPYGDVINRCIDYILGHQRENGALDRGYGEGGMYSHCISTLLLSESSGMVEPERQKRIDAVLPKALKIILAAQSIRKPPPYQGGWRYQTDSVDSDISVSGWALMALRSARLNGAAVPKEAIESAAEFILKCRSGDGGFAYQPRGGSGVARTGVALLCLELTGHHADEVTKKAGDYILKPIKAGRFIEDNHFHYALYYCAQGMFQLGGEQWEQFAEAMYKHLLPSQSQNGSWRGPGEAYSTAMSVLALNVACRQLPIYQR